MKVPLLDLKPQYAQIKDKVIPEIMEIIENQGFILGPKVDRLEKEMADYIGTKHTLGCSSGTDALLLALMALDIGRGDEVITTPYTFFATAGSIARVGAVARFVDIDPATFLMRVDQI
ncbi:MAG TPA: DegT/DnrJ/EryC1/StrS family aminotransferase, partial [Candidatus Rifleibacterium sp.]|nr:DegT/DnrJ/EryC1/StrS family aminotransferase [Candidatus Rifleibacterium sp.]